MDITELYNTIIERLNKAGNKGMAEDLDNLLAAAATGGEGLSSTGKYLYDLKTDAPSVYKSIEELIVEYLKYCRKNGIIIE
jgi:hypothetical protein